MTKYQGQRLNTLISKMDGSVLVGKPFPKTCQLHCAAHYEVEKHGGRIEYQYGDFLRAVGGRPRASGSREASHNSVSEEGTGCEAEKRAVQAEQGGPVGTMTAHAFSHENPRVTDKESTVNQGKGLDAGHVDSSELNAHAHTTDTNSALKETVPKFQ
nr:hypothetical protein CFP56_42327 [Quercus suber]